MKGQFEMFFNYIYLISVPYQHTTLGEYILSCVLIYPLLYFAYYISQCLPSLWQLFFSQRLSSLAYSRKGLELFWVHSTIGMAMLWALFKGSPIRDMCAVVCHVLHKSASCIRSLFWLRCGGPFHGSYDALRSSRLVPTM